MLSPSHTQGSTRCLSKQKLTEFMADNFTGLHMQALLEQRIPCGSTSQG